MKITEQEVRRVADLANLALREDEVARMAQDLDGILSHIDKLNELDTTDVEPMAQVLFDAEETATLREDRERPSLSNAEAVGERSGDQRRILQGAEGDRDDEQPALRTQHRFDPRRLAGKEVQRRGTGPPIAGLCRSGKSQDQRLPDAFAGAGAERGARGGREDCQRRRSGSAGGRAGRGEGRHRHARAADHVRLETAGELCSSRTMPRR